MDKNILIKYINGTASDDECKHVMMWAEKSKDNRDYLISLMNMSAILPDNAPKASDFQYELFMNREGQKNKDSWMKVIKYAAAIILLLSVTLNIYMLNRDNDKSPILAYTELAKPDSIFQEVYVAKGAKSKITLPDSSTVWLNSNSRIKFPLAFSEGVRLVELSGEAYFDVSKDSSRPMIVSVGSDYFIKVLGTQFNVRAYNNEDEIYATLYSGKINIVSPSKNNKQEKVICEMTPNQKSIIKGNKILTQDVQLFGMEKISSWKKGILYFDETPMLDVIKNLERWHGLEFEITDKNVLDYTITAKFDNESIVQILEMIKLCAPIDYRIEDKTAILSLQK